MSLFTKSLRTRQRNEFVDITREIQSCIAESNVIHGLVTIFIPHTTAAVTINENADPDVRKDLGHKLSLLIPEQEDFYRHAEGNSDAHMKSSLFGPSLTLIIENGRCLLGTWQGIYFCEFDGPRTRSYHVKIVEG